MYINESYAVSSKKSYQDSMEAFLVIFEIGLALITKRALRSENIQSIQAGGMAAIPAYKEILEAGLSAVINDQPGFVDVYNTLKRKPDTQKLAEIIWKRNFVENSQWKYLVDNTILNHRKKFIERVTDLISDTRFVKYPYNDSIWETSYYNYLIGEYLKNVKLMNEEFKTFREFTP